MTDHIRLRLLVFCEATDGGVAQHLLDLLEFYNEKGIEVTIVYSPNRLAERFASRLAKLSNVTAITLPISETPSVSWFRSVLKLRSIVKSKGPFDILHSQSSIAGGILRLASLNLPGANIYTPHCLKTADPNQSSLKKSIYGSIERYLAKINTCKIICVSEWERQHALLFGLPREKLAVVNNGIDQRLISPKAISRSTLSIPDNEFAIGFVGRLVLQKSPQSLISIAAKVIDLALPIRIHIIGDGPLLNELMEEIAAKNLSSCFYFHGQCDGPGLISAFDLVVMPSIYEGFSYVMLEALAAGVPVLSADCGAARELLIETGAGAVTPVGDEEQFSQEAVNLVLDKKRLERMSLRAREVAGRFTVGRMASETIEIYQTVLG